MTFEQPADHGQLELRCDPLTGRGCEDAIARTAAGMRLIYVEHDRDCGEQMLAQARWWAAQHGVDVERQQRDVDEDGHT